MTAGEGPEGALAGLAEDLAGALAVLAADLVEVAALADGVDMGRTYLASAGGNKKAALLRGAFDGIALATVRHRSRVGGRSIRRRVAIE